MFTCKSTPEFGSSKQGTNFYLALEIMPHTPGPTILFSSYQKKIIKWCTTYLPYLPCSYFLLISNVYKVMLKI